MEQETVTQAALAVSVILNLLPHLLAKFGNPYWRGIGEILRIVAGNYGEAKNRKKNLKP